MIILYAEDDAEDADVFCEAVKSIDNSIGCILARDGNEVISILESTVILPDLIFLDINMPLVDGRECLRRIKSNSAFQSIPVIMYTTSNRTQDISELKKLGAADYIVKPNTFSEVLVSLSVAIRKAS